MNINLMPFLYVFAVLVAGVLVLFIMRKKVASHEDDTLHVSGAVANVITEQAEVAQKLEQIDRWGKTLTIITFIYGILVAAAWVYKGWMDATYSMGK
jgi:uncharacterized membrane protein